MSNRDNFILSTKRILSERAGQRCSNPDCNRSTSGPSDDTPDRSTILGKAAHITAASKGGPRYDPTLTPEERKSPNNGIWLCSECADRIDKKENEKKYPLELLLHWKTLHESLTASDFANSNYKKFYPVKKLTLIDFCGVVGEAEINFGAINVFNGTLKLNKSIGEILNIFSDRECFQKTRQIDTPRSAPVGKVILNLTNDENFILTANTDNATIANGDTPLPLFTPCINTISVQPGFNYTVFGPRFSHQEKNTLIGLSEYFGVSLNELKDCIKGTPSDISIFGYHYKIQDDTELYIKLRNNRDFFSLNMLSGGEKDRFILDMAIKLAKYSSYVKGTMLTINQSALVSLDPKGWGHMMEWLEKKQFPFQVIIERNYPPSEGDIYKTLCYDTIGTDMEVVKFQLVPWRNFMKSSTIKES